MCRCRHGITRSIWAVSHKTLTLLTCNYQHFFMFVEFSSLLTLSRSHVNLGESCVSTKIHLKCA